MRKLCFTLLLNLIAFCTVFAQHKNPVFDQFFSYLNNYETDSLTKILSSDFTFKRSVNNETINKADFLQLYLPSVKQVNGKYNIIKEDYQNNETLILVEDNSDLIKYLKIKRPQWHIILIANATQITAMQLDTAVGNKEYQDNASEKIKQFFIWEKANHPNESTQAINADAKLFLKRLKEFSESDQ